MKIQAFGIVALLLLAVIAAVPANAALSPLGITVNDVKVDGNSITANQTVKTNFERDSELELKISLQTDSSSTVEDVVVQAFITGAKDSISDETDAFDVQANTIYTKTLSLTVPERTTDREYQLRVIVSSPNSDTISYVYPLMVSAVDNSVAIKDVTFSPNDKVIAGRAMTAVARLKNYGQKDETDVKVVFSIPELGIQETDYVDTIDEDDTVSTEEVLLRIPASTKSGEYTVKVDVYFNDYDDKTSATYVINVAGDDQAASATGLSGKTTIAVGLQTQSVAKGENGVIYPLSLTNGASSAKTYTLTVSGADGWAVTKVSPSNVLILNAGETKQAYVYVAANENAATGEHVFSVDIRVGNDVVQQVPLKADVLESANNSAWAGVKKALSVGVILLVVLIIALGAVVIYQRKFKSADETKEDEQIAQTYY